MKRMLSQGMPPNVCYFGNPTLSDTLIITNLLRGNRESSSGSSKGGE